MPEDSEYTTKSQYAGSEPAVDSENAESPEDYAASGPLTTARHDSNTSRPYTEVTETTATYQDRHSRHISDDFVVPYNEHRDILPALFESIDPSDSHHEMNRSIQQTAADASMSEHYELQSVQQSQSNATQMKQCNEADCKNEEEKLQCETLHIQGIMKPSQSRSHHQKHDSNDVLHLSPIGIPDHHKPDNHPRSHLMPIQAHQYARSLGLPSQHLPSNDRDRRKSHNNVVDQSIAIDAEHVHVDEQRLYPHSNANLRHQDRTHRKSRNYKNNMEQIQKSMHEQEEQPQHVYSQHSHSHSHSHSQSQSQKHIHNVGADTEREANKSYHNGASPVMSAATHSLIHSQSTQRTLHTNTNIDFDTNQTHRTRPTDSTQIASFCTYTHTTPLHTKQTDTATSINVPVLRQSNSDHRDIRLVNEQFYHEMDEDFYDFLSECVCRFFRKLDTNKTQAVSRDLLRICFSVIDITFSDAQFNMLINELTNFRPNRGITLDMLRCFILNIQNKTFPTTLSEIRRRIIDGLITSHQSSLNSNTNTNSNANNNAHERNKSRLYNVPDHMNKSQIISYEQQTSPSMISMNVPPSNDQAHRRMRTPPSYTMDDSYTHSQFHSMSTFVSNNTMEFPYFDPAPPSQHAIDIASTPRKKKKKAKHTDMHDSSTSPHTKQRRTNFALDLGYPHTTNRANKIYDDSYEMGVWRPRITDHDEHGTYQYDLLLCTLKYSLISSAIQMYRNNDLNIDQEKFGVYTANQAEKQALQYLFDAYYDFMSNANELMHFNLFKNGLKRCGIMANGDDVVFAAFQQLATVFKDPYKSTEQPLLLISKISFVSWIIGSIFNVRRTNYLNYHKDYTQYYKWIEKDLFDVLRGNITPVQHENSHTPQSGGKQKDRLLHHPYSTIITPMTQKKSRRKSRVPSPSKLSKYERQKRTRSPHKRGPYLQ